MEFPLLSRELDRQARSKVTFGLRMVLCLLVLSYFSLITLVNWIAEFQSGSFIIFFISMSPDVVGEMLARFATTFQFAAAMFVPPIVVGGSIAREYEERTLGLLALADRRGADLVLSKFLGGLIPVLLLIVSALPIQAFSLLLGGLQADELLWKIILFSVAALTVSAASVFVSSIMKRVGAAQLAMLGIVLVSLLLDPVAAWAGLTGGPAHIGLLGFYADEYLPIPWFWAPSVSISLALSVLFLAVTIWLLPRRVAENGVIAKTHQEQRRPRNATESPITSPLHDLINRGLGKSFSGIRPWPVWMLASFLACLLIISFGFFSFVGFFLLVFIAFYDLVSSLESARRRGVFSDVYAATTDDCQTTRTTYQVVFFRSMFYFPAFFVAGEFGQRYFLLTSWPETFAAAMENGPGAFLTVFIGVYGPIVLMTVCELAFLTAIACAALQKRRSVAAIITTSTITFILYDALWLGFRFSAVPVFMLIDVELYSRPLLGSLARNTTGLLFFLGLAYLYYARFRRIFVRGKFERSRAHVLANP